MTGGTCREGCGPCGGSRGGPEEQGKHLHWENIGKHLEMHQHQGRFQFHTYPNVLYICYIFVGQLKWLFTFCAVQGQVRLVRMRGNVDEIPSNLMLKKVTLTKYKIPSKETREEPFRFAHPRPHFRNSSPFLVDFRFLQISHHFHFP